MSLLLAGLLLALTACGSSGGSAQSEDGGSPRDAPSTTDGPPAEKDGAVTTATLSWDAPTTYTNGTPLTVAGYHVYYGTMSRAYGLPEDVKSATSYVFSAPKPATYYFAVTAYDSSGSESELSTEVSKTLE